MNESVVVPALLSMMLLKDAVEAALAEGKAGVLLDGFPRSVEQASAFEEEVRSSIPDKHACLTVWSPS